MRETQTADKTARKKFERILAVGPAGAGKTTQIITLPGRKFVYAFAPQAVNSLQGQPDIDYVEFLSEGEAMPAFTLMGEAKRTQRGLPPPRTERPKEALGNVYEEWREDYNERLRSGFFDDYQVVAIDDLTAFADVCMDRVLFLAGRYGQAPQLDDYTPQMTLIRNALRSISCLPLLVYVCAHEDARQDELTKKISTEILVTGRLRKSLPQLFSEIYAFECVSTKEEERYIIQTRPDRNYRFIRSTLRGLSFSEDVTIKDWQHPERYGIGKLLQSASKQ